jgi:hypothetical protein
MEWPVSKYLATLQALRITQKLGRFFIIQRAMAGQFEIL